MCAQHISWRSGARSLLRPSPSPAISSRTAWVLRQLALCGLLEFELVLDEMYLCKARKRRMISVVHR